MNSFLLANMVWPALLMAIRLFAWWFIIASLLVEAAALCKFCKISPGRALFGALAANLASALLGLLLLPVIGVELEFVADTTYNVWFGFGTFNPVTQVATWVAATLLNTVVELTVLWLVAVLPLSRRLGLVVLLANAATATIAAVSLIFHTPQ